VRDVKSSVAAALGLSLSEPASSLMNYMMVSASTGNAIGGCIILRISPMLGVP